MSRVYHVIRSFCEHGLKTKDIKGAWSWRVLNNLRSVLILSITIHPRSFMVCYHLFSSFYTVVIFLLFLISFELKLISIRTIQLLFIAVTCILMPFLEVW